MLETMKQSWWMLTVRGVAAILFGVLALLWPSLTLMVLVLLFGAYALVDGAFAIAAVVRRSSGGERSWALALEGAMGVAAGIIAFVWPGITALVLLYIIAFWAILSGAFQIAGAVKLRKEIKGEWLMMVAGLLSVVFGVLLALFPGPGALALVWMISFYAIFFGVLLVGLGIRMRHEGHAPHDRMPHTPTPAH